MAKIKDLSQEIKSNWGQFGRPEFFEPDGQCDKLLQEFHRFDEGIGIDGKWGGGSVTSVCRGWGSTKVSIKYVMPILS